MRRCQRISEKSTPRQSVEEHGYLFHRQVQDPLTANLTAIENILSTRKNTAVDDVFEIL